MMASIAVLAGVGFHNKDAILDLAARTGLMPAEFVTAPGSAPPGDGGAPGGSAVTSSGTGGHHGKDAKGQSPGANKSAGDATSGTNGRKEAPGKRGRLDAAAKGPPGKSGAEMKEWGSKIVAMKGSPQLDAELEKFLTGITPENWREAAEAALPLYDFLHPDKWAAVMVRLGAVAGRDAMERFKPSNTLVQYEGYGARSAMRGWTMTDRAAAEAFVESLPEGRYRDGMGIGFLRGIDEASTASLEKLYDQLPRSLWPQISAAQRDMVRWETPGSDAGMNNWLAGVESSAGHDSERFKVAQETFDLHFLESAMWDKNAAKVASLTNAYLDRPSNETTDRVLNTALASLSSFEPAQALDLVQANSSKRPALEQSIPTIFTDWASRDSGAAGDWLNAHSSVGFYDSAAAAYAVGIKKDDPAAAQAWAGTIKSPVLRETTLKNLKP